MALSLFAPRPASSDFHCARVYRGTYDAGDDIRSRIITLDFRVIHGEAEVTSGRPVAIYQSASESDAIPETFYIFPTSPYVSVNLTGPRGTKMLRLFREDDRSKSRMFKQRF